MLFLTDLQQNVVSETLLKNLVRPYSSCIVTMPFYSVPDVTKKTLTIFQVLDLKNYGESLWKANNLGASHWSTLGEKKRVELEKTAEKFLSKEFEENWIKIVTDP